MLNYAGLHRARHFSHAHYAGETAAALARAEEKLERVEEQKQSKREMAKKVGKMVMSKAVSSGVAGALGYWQGMGKPVEVKGIPLPLVAGGVAFGAAVAAEMGYGPPMLKKAARTLDDISTGCFAFEAANYGNAKGLEYAAKQAKAPASAPASTMGFSGHDPAQFAPHVDTTSVADERTSVPYGYR